MSQVRIKTPSRLHFGLLGLGNPARRQYGGLGLMIEDPGLEIIVEPADRWEAKGPQSDRALTIAQSVAQHLARMGRILDPLKIQILQSPEPHVGLGVGTQLSMAIAQALALHTGMTEFTPRQLAELTGRGNRSGIGIHGFAEGGLIVDAGRRGNEIPTRVLRTPFPDEWFILIVQPESHAGLHGNAEIEAFHLLPPISETITEQLSGLVLLRLIPAVLEKDLQEFGRTLEQVQETVGRCFEPVQGGAYSSLFLRTVVEAMRGNGLHGVGQSSWGPTLYGFSNAALEKRAQIRDRLRKSLSLRDERIRWTHASDHGAKVIVQ